MEFLIRNAEDKAAILSYIQRLPADKEYSVTISRAAKKRTVSQNSLYWLWLTCIESETGQDKGSLHLFFKQQFLAERQAIFEGASYLTEPSTSELSVQEFTRYLNKIQIFAAAELGIVLPVPEDQIFTQFQEQYDIRDYGN